MKRCTKCIMPESKPGIIFNDEGICNACLNADEAAKVDWDLRWYELESLACKAIKIKPKNYNCLLPVSGGKDSIFMAFMVRALGLIPLLVYVEPAYITERGKRNIQNLIDLGFDCYVFKPSRDILPELLYRSFKEEGQPVRAFEFMLCSVPMQMAVSFRTPLVIWGEDAQYVYGNPGSGTMGNAMQRSHTVVMKGQGPERWVSDNVFLNRLHSYGHPTSEELDVAGVHALYLSYYVPWDSRKNAEFAIARGLEVRPDHEVWRSGGYWPFEQLDDEIPVISHYLKYLKFGYGRATDQACRDLRWGYIDREDALALARTHDGRIDFRFIERYCDFIGITTDEFVSIADSWRGQMWTKANHGWELNL